MSMLDASELSGPQYYRLMGSSPFAGTTLGAIGSWVAVTVLAAIYAYADLYIKVVDKLSILILIVFAVAMGFAVAGVLRLTKVRNLLVIGIIALTSSLLALYVSWVVWEAALLRRDGVMIVPWELFPRPDIVWEIARGVNEEGSFMLRDKPVNGTELWLAWGIEALAIVGCTLFIPLLSLRRLAFCEECQSWCEKRPNLIQCRMSDELVVRDHVERKDLEYLAGLGPPEENDVAFLNAELMRCPRCGQTNLLTVNRVTVTDANGQRSENVKPVVDRLWLNAAEAEVVLSLPQRMIKEPAEGPANAGVAAASNPATSSPDAHPTGTGRIE